MYNIILEVAFMLKAAGLPGSDARCAAVSLLDWYTLDQELILVMERPVSAKDLYWYLRSRRGFLDETEAKVMKLDALIVYVCACCLIPLTIISC